MGKNENNISSGIIRDKVIKTRSIQLQRSGKLNNALDNQELETYCLPGKKGLQILNRAIDQLGLSARSFHRILKVSRTIADLDQSEDVSTRHITEAISYRKLDRH